MSSFGSPSPFFLAGKKAYEVERSLRFNFNDSPYLNRTFGSAGNRKTYTVSAWVKIGGQGTTRPIFTRYTGNSDAGFLGLYVNSDDFIYFTGWSTVYLKSNRIYRDQSAWSHIVLAVDTTQSTSTDRIKLYFNGELQSNATYNAPSQNADLVINEAAEHRVGNYQNLYFDGYMTEVNFIDGQAYDPSYFGETDAITGQWNPKKYSGSYGTNGFYLNFSDNSGTTATTLGKDSSGNGNNFTPNNFSVSAGAGNDSVEDTPTNNFPTFNPIFKNSSGSYDNNSSVTDGNLAHSSVGSETNAYATFALPSSGKYYWEVRLSSISTASIGIIVYSGNANRSIFFNHNGTIFQDNASSQTGLNSWSNGDTIGIAYDGDNQTLQFYRQGSSQGSALTLTAFTESYFPISRINAYADINFGQRAFSYTPPTGFKALNSANLPDPTIKLPNKHFDILLYTGNGSTNNITGLNFSPDWVWGKTRNTSAVHYLFDQVRGVNKYLDTQTDSETTSQTDLLTAFNSDGFTLGANAGSKQVNKNGNSYVAWNWDAGETDGKTYTVKVVSDSGNKYRFDNFGTSAVTLDLAEGGTYIFDQSDSSNAGHPLRFSTTSNGTHGGGSEYTTGVTTAGTPGQSGAYTQIVVAASAPTLYYYCTQHSGMGGQANTNSTLGSSNFDGTIQSTVKTSTTAGFSIVTYTGTSASTATIGHGLGVTPKVIIVRERDATSQWAYFQTELGFGNKLQLDSTSQSGSSALMNSTAPTSTVFTVKNTSSGDVLNNGGLFIAYCFSEVAGYSKFGSYIGNGSSDGTFVYTGFRPAWILIKRTNSASEWSLYDTARKTFNVGDLRLEANSASAEDSNSVNYHDILSNGFKMRNSDAARNGNGSTYIYLAFAESPFKNARAR